MNIELKEKNQKEEKEKVAIHVGPPTICIASLFFEIVH